MLRTVLVLSLMLPALSGVGQAQMSPAVEPTAIASPGVGPVSMSTPAAAWRSSPRMMHRRAVAIVRLALRVLLVLSLSFALIALGIFLIRRSRPGR